MRLKNYNTLNRLILFIFQLMTLFVIQLLLKSSMLMKKLHQNSAAILQKRQKNLWLSQVLQAMKPLVNQLVIRKQIMIRKKVGQLQVNHKLVMQVMTFTKLQQ